MQLGVDVFCRKPGKKPIPLLQVQSKYFFSDEKRGFEKGVLLYLQHLMTLSRTIERRDED
jgi:hypothetical protein